MDGPQSMSGKLRAEAILYTILCSTCLHSLREVGYREHTIEGSPSCNYLIPCFISDAEKIPMKFGIGGLHGYNFYSNLSSIISVLHEAK
jgi:hypothetical protein